MSWYRYWQCLTLKVLNFWKFTSYCSLKPLWSGMGEVVPARTSPTLHPPSPPTVHQLSRLALWELKSMPAELNEFHLVRQPSTLFNQLLQLFYVLITESLWAISTIFSYFKLPFHWISTWNWTASSQVKMENCKKINQGKHWNKEIHLSGPWNIQCSAQL